MRSSPISAYKNTKIAKKFMVIAAFVAVSACSPLSNRIAAPVDSGTAYPIAAGFVTNSISSQDVTSPAPSRYVRSAALAPVEDVETITPMVRPVRVPSSGVAVVRPGDTLLGVAREHGVDAVDLADLNGLDAPYALKAGDELVLPGSKLAETMDAKSRVETTRVASKPKSLGRIPAERVANVQIKKTKIKKSVRVASKVSKQSQKVAIPRKKVASVAKKSVKVQKLAAKKSTGTLKRRNTKVAVLQKTETVRKAPVQKAPAVAASKNTGNKFRWPVKGRVIAEFGSQANGSKNDGINLSVPKGAAIVAAEKGVVAYSGNELKGYGNLVLIRHADGWATAYAHNSALLVKKGQTVRRGQVIAKAGQSGAVSSPQLHFEIRRGANAVDPRTYLSGPKVASR